MIGIMIGINKKKSKGFTLIELIVVMAVFLLVIGVAIGIFISIVRQQKRILFEQQLLNQTSYVMEYMSKALRMVKRDEAGECLGPDYVGYIYLLTRPDTNLETYRGIKFINQTDSDSCQEFYIDYQVANDPSKGFILKEIKNGVPLDGIALTSDKLKIISAKFGINGGNGAIGGPIGASANDAVQPRVTISLDVQIGSGTQQTTKKIQTTVSQRNLNAK